MKNLAQPPMAAQAEPNARQMLMNLLRVADEPLDTARAVRACALFGISANNTRVALNRLVAAGLAEPVTRGAHQLGPHGRALADEVGAWRHAEQALQPWAGDWVMVLTGGLGRVDRHALRARERALALAGMKPLDTDVYIRPANIASGVDLIRSRLVALGLPPQAAVFLARDFDTDRAQRAPALWDTEALLKGYRQGLEALAASLTRLPTLPVADAARHAYLTGNQAIRHLVFDPLLPEPLVPTRERVAYRAEVLHYESVGRRVWQAFFDSV